VPTAPTGVTSGSVTAYSATASWTDASGDETGFKVQYAPSPYSSWTTFAGSPTAANATSLATGDVLTPDTPYKLRVASTNANGDSAWVESGIFTTLALVRIPVIADTSVGAWTASSGSDRYAMIDESTPSNTDFITVSSSSVCVLKVQPTSTPPTRTSHTVPYRCDATAGQLKVSLVEGHPSGTVRKTETRTPAGSPTDYVMTLTSGEAAAITDYSNLYLHFESL
jgi:hypothetical protein